MVADPPPAAERRPTPTSSSSAPGPAARPPRTTWPGTALRRAAAGEVRVPAREGLRRRADPARRQAAHRHGHRHQRGGRLAAQPGLRVIGGGVTPRAGLARRSRASPTTAWSAPGWTSTSCSPGTPSQVGRAAARQTPPSPAPVIDERTGRVVGVAGDVGPDKDKRRSPSAPRWSSPPTASPAGSRSRSASPSATTGRSASPSAATTAAPGTHDDYLESWLELWDRSDPANAKLLPGYGWIFGMGDGRVQRRPRRAQSTAALRARRNYRALLARLAGRHARGVGLPTRRTRTVRSAAPPCRWGSTGCRTTRRGVLLVGDAGGHGQPVQRRGHRVRDGVRRASPPRCAVQALARPAAPPRRRRWRATRRSCRRARRLLPARRAVLKLIGDPTIMRLRHPARPAPPDADAVRAQAAGEPAPTRKDGDAMDRVITAMTRLAPSV